MVAKNINDKLRRQLARLANDAATATGRKAATALRKMANKAGLRVESGGKHFRVIDSETGRSVTRIPRSPHAKPTIEAIARAIMNAAENEGDFE